MCVCVCVCLHVCACANVLSFYVWLTIHVLDCIWIEHLNEIINICISYNTADKFVFGFTVIHYIEYLSGLRVCF